MQRPEHDSAHASGDPARPGAQKSADAYRTIGEVADELKLPQHVLRFWETRFPEVKPLKRAGGRRFYRPEDVAVLRAVRSLLYGEGYTIKGVQRLFGEFGAPQVVEALARPEGLSARCGSGPPGPVRDGGGGTAMPKTDAEERPDPAPAPPRPAPPPAGAAHPPAAAGNRPDMVKVLENVLADLGECDRILASLVAT